MGDNNAGAVLIRALHLPLRDVHDLCATGDVDYLIEFAKDEAHRASAGLGRPHSAARKATSPVRRAEYLQGSKVAELKEKEAEERELAARKKRREEIIRRRKAEAEADSRDAAGGDYQQSEGGSSHAEIAAASRATEAGAAADDEDGNEGEERNKLKNNSNPELNVSVGAGCTQKDWVPIDTVFPRPRLGKTATAASEEAAFNTVGLGVVSVRDLVNFRDEHGLLPIHTASVFGQGRVIDFLLTHGADIESAVPGTLQRPLHLAVLNGHHALARRLVEEHNADPGALTAEFELPLTIARRHRAAELELYFKEKCRERIASKDSLRAAFNGELLFFAYHAQCDSDGGKKCFTEDFVAARPKDKAPSAAAGATGCAVSLEALIRDPMSTPLDIAIASIGNDAVLSNEQRTFKVIAEILLRGKYFDLNDLRESSGTAVTPLYLAVSCPTREGISLLLKYGADPRVASVSVSAPTKILKLTLAEAEAKVVFEDFYKTRDDVPFADRSEYVITVTGLREKWRRAKRALERAIDREEALAAAAGQEGQ